LKNNELFAVTLVIGIFLGAVVTYGAFVIGDEIAEQTLEGIKNMPVGMIDKDKFASLPEPVVDIENRLVMFEYKDEYVFCDILMEEGDFGNCRTYPKPKLNLNFKLSDVITTDSIDDRIFANDTEKYEIIHYNKTETVTETWNAIDQCINEYNKLNEECK